MTCLSADVCVVGGGPAGSATAWALASAGADVVLLDRASFPRDKPCAEYLSPEASRILAAMSVLGEIEPHASLLSGMRVRSPRGEWLHGEFAGAHGFRGYSDQGIAVRRTILDAALLGAAGGAGARIVEGARVLDLERTDAGRVSGVRATAGAGSDLRVTARLVIGADGLRSVVARKAGVARRSRWPSRLALTGHYVGVTGLTSAGEMHVEPGGYFGLAPVGTVTNVAVVVPTSVGRTVAGRADRFLEDWIEQRPHLRERFTGARRAGPVRATGPFASRATKPWVPGVALVGDAADFYDPFTGEGIYAALRGAEILAPLALAALADARSEPTQMTAYRDARRREFAGKWAVERLVSIAISQPILMNRFTATLARRKDLADLLVGVCGDFVPPRELLRPGFLLPLLLGGRTAPA
ncbi:MAG TPA: NAD(P)/FAD-dependent oxidoreductase [Gemmatimonadaceae bacterium]